jgi:hypothetical protein
LGSRLRIVSPPQRDVRVVRRTIGTVGKHRADATWPDWALEELAR